VGSAEQKDRKEHWAVLENTESDSLQVHDKGDSVPSGCCLGAVVLQRAVWRPSCLGYNVDKPPRVFLEFNLMPVSRHPSTSMAEHHRMFHRTHPLLQVVTKAIVLCRVMGPALLIRPLGLWCFVITAERAKTGSDK
jgi:hypothetical protein